jgi:hypothetical protein
VIEPRDAAPKPSLAEATHATWVQLNNEATDGLAVGEFLVAVEKLERCHAGEPENPVFAGNLAEAFVRLARHEREADQLSSAIAHLERALEVGSRRADRDVLHQMLERWRQELELERDDTSDTSTRFSLSYDVDRTELLHHSHLVLEHLEQSYDELVRWLGMDPLADAPPTRVILYEPEDFDRLTGLGDWAAGVFDGVVRVSLRDLQSGDSWRAVLTHELVHAFARALAGSAVPGWLNEGLAQLLEPRSADAARSALPASEPLFTLSELTGSLAGWANPAAIARAYAQSLLFVEYLQRTYGDEALRRMLIGCAGLGPAAAFERFTSVALEVAFQDWSATPGR